MNDNVKKWLLYTGTAGAVISAIAYIIITYTIIVGFESAIDQQKQILFSLLGSATGLMITFFLRSQGISFAQREDESKQVMAEYYKLINKTKKKRKLHTIKHFMVTQTIKDIFSKGLSIALSTWFVMYIFMEGNGDWSLFRLALSNIAMFAGFGLMALSKAYDKYITEHIPIIREITQRLKNNDQDGSIHPKEKENANLREQEIFIASGTSSEKQE